jgi:hypothetical protein
MPKWHSGIEQGRCRGTDYGEGGGHHTGDREKAGDTGQVRERERPPKPALEQPGHGDGLSSAEDAPEHCSQEAPVDQEAGSEGASYKAYHKRWICAATKDDQDPGGDAGRWAERGHIGGPSQ